MTRLARIAFAIAGADVLVRVALATALQLGIATGVGLMLEMQRRVALTDDEPRCQRPASC